MVINTLINNYSTGEMVINTLNTNYSTGGMVINTLNTNYSTGGKVISTQHTNYSTKNNFPPVASAPAIQYAAANFNNLLFYVN